jgi:hypothetical protein
MGNLDMGKNYGIDTLTNTQRIKIAIRLAKEHRRMSYPDVCSLAFIGALIDDLRVEGFTEEEIRYAMTRAYSKRIKKYECIEQFSQHPMIFFDR